MRTSFTTRRVFLRVEEHESIVETPRDCCVSVSGAECQRADQSIEVIPPHNFRELFHQLRIGLTGNLCAYIRPVFGDDNPSKYAITAYNKETRERMYLSVDGTWKLWQRSGSSNPTDILIIDFSAVTQLAAKD